MVVRTENPEALRGGSRDGIVLVTADRYREQIVEQLKSLGYRGCVVTLSELADNDFPNRTDCMIKAVDPTSECTAAFPG